MDEGYSNDAVLKATRYFWAVREQGCTNTRAGSIMLDVSRAYDQLDMEEQVQLMLGVWLEQEPIPKAVITKMRHYLNGD
jgi:hypothetical protein